MKIPEKYLRFIWNYQLLIAENLKTTSGQTVKISDQGQLNQHEGPDFLNARLTIDGQKVQGHVELHSRSSDWLRHNHDDNDKYEKVVLHVVFQADKVYPEHIPILEVREYINKPLFKLVCDVFQAEALDHPDGLLCAASLHTVSMNIKQNWIKKLGYVRLYHRFQRLSHHIKEEDYDTPLFEGIARALGYSQNKSAMEILLSGLPMEQLKRFLSHSLTRRTDVIEAILFTQSGLLEPANSTLDSESVAYLKRTRQLYRYSGLKRAVILQKSDWNFFRLRPANFPTLRLAGFARLLAKSLTDSLVYQADTIVRIEQPMDKMVSGLIDLFYVEADGYWSHYYQFGKKARQPVSVFVGKSRAQAIVVNTLLPLLMVYYHNKGQRLQWQKIFGLYARLSDNQCSMEIKEKGRYLIGSHRLRNKVLIHQGIIELKEAYCNQLQCLNCKIGRMLLNKVQK
jgi:hypothetical protein